VELTDTDPIPCDAVQVRNGQVYLLHHPPKPAPKAVSIHPDAKYLTAKEAAVYLGLTYGTFRHKATKIRRTKHGRYTREALDDFAKRG
jgi:hypothetical protein